MLLKLSYNSKNNAQKVSNMRTIGIFPLRLVLFPESAYPLHIFEERYKSLINRCIKERSHFGINFMSNDGMKEVGCTATITDLMRQYPDGRMDIIVAGVRRYKLESFSDGADKYYIGQVKYFDDEDRKIDASLLNKCIELYNRIADLIKTIQIDKIIPDEITTQYPSFYLAQKSGLTIEQRQLLLESLSENVRLRILYEHYKRLFPSIKTMDDIQKIIKNDGYLKSDFPTK